MDSQYSDKSGAASAYGSGGATGQFDPIAIVKKPQVILRLLSVVSRSDSNILLIRLLTLACVA